MESRTERKRFEQPRGQIKLKCGGEKDIKIFAGYLGENMLQTYFRSEDNARLNFLAHVRI